MPAAMTPPPSASTTPPPADTKASIATPSTTTTKTMTAPAIQVQPMTTLADFATYTELTQNAFRHGLHAATYSTPAGFSTAARADLCASMLATAQRNAAAARSGAPSPGILRDGEPTTYVVKAVDSALESSGCDPLGGIVGVATWVFYPARAPEAVDAAVAAACESAPPTDADPAFVAAWRRAVEGAKRSVLGGRAYCYLSVLVTREGFQRRGIGRAIMDRGLRHADDAGLPVYLEASQAGLALYKKVGFEIRGPLPFDASPWCDTDALDHILMVRPSGFRPQSSLSGGALHDVRHDLNLGLVEVLTCS